MGDSEVVRRKIGRPTIVNDELILQAHQYLESCDNTPDLPTIEGLALSLNISRETIYDWESKDTSPEFSDIVMKLRSSQAQKLIQNSLQGKYNPMISKLLLSKHGYVEKKEVDNNIVMPQPILGSASRKVIEADNGTE